jgi:steroid delta-isomerase-like uncharacterized protein
VSADANKELIRRLFDEVFNTGDVDRLDELATPEVAVGGKRYVAERRSFFPDLRYTIEEQIAEGDRVVTRWSMRGTNTGPLRDRPATGRPIEAEGVFIWRIADGRIAGIAMFMDHLSVRQQLGLLPVDG